MAAVSHAKPVRIKLGCARVRSEMGKIGSAALRSMKTKIGIAMTKEPSREMTAGWVHGYPEEVARDVPTESDDI